MYLQVYIRLVTAISSYCSYEQS